MPSYFLGSSECVVFRKGIMSGAIGTTFILRDAGPVCDSDLLKVDYASSTPRLKRPLTGTLDCVLSERTWLNYTTEESVAQKPINQIFSKYHSLVGHLNAGGLERSENDLTRPFLNILEAIGLHTVFDSSQRTSRHKRPDIFAYLDPTNADLVLRAHSGVWRIEKRTVHAN